MSHQGIVFDIKRFAVHDGPGIRTTVFLKGCYLACQWCHNPESMNPSVCTVSSHIQLGDKLIDDEEITGRLMTVEELMIELRKEQIFMEESGGGVTFSGGEPLFQRMFLEQALNACKAVGLHTAVDTSGYCMPEIPQGVIENTDLFLYDLKIMDDALHRKHTGFSNQIILQNLLHLLQAGKKVRIRIPLVPDISFTDENITATIEFLKDYKDDIESVDLLPYHNMANHKYKRFEIENTLPHLKNVKKEEIQATFEKFSTFGFSVTIGG